MELYATKRPNGFQILGEDNIEQFDKLKNGQIYKLITKKERDKGYHRKVLGMLRCAFDQWDPNPAKLPAGVEAQKDFEKFRKDLTIKVGFCDYVWSLDGALETRARSISYDNMDQVEFEELFNAYVEAILNSDIVPQNEVMAKSFRDLIVSYL